MKRVPLVIALLVVAYLNSGCAIPVKMSEEKYDAKADEILCKSHATTPLQAVRCVPPMLR